MKVVNLSALRIGRLYPPGNIPGTHFCYRLSRPQGHSAAGRIRSMKISSDTIGNRTRDLPACSVQIAITDSAVWTKILDGHYDFSRRTLTVSGGEFGSCIVSQRVRISVFHNPTTYTFFDCSFLRYLKKSTEKKMNVDPREAVTGQKRKLRKSELHKFKWG